MYCQVRRLKIEIGKIINESNSLILQARKQPWNLGSGFGYWNLGIGPGIPNANGGNGVVDSDWFNLPFMTLFPQSNPFQRIAYKNRQLSKK